MNFVLGKRRLNRILRDLESTEDNINKKPKISDSYSDTEPQNDQDGGSDESSFFIKLEEGEDEIPPKQHVLQDGTKIYTNLPSHKLPEINPIYMKNYVKFEELFIADINKSRATPNDQNNQFKVQNCILGTFAFEERFMTPIFKLNIPILLIKNSEKSSIVSIKKHPDYPKVTFAIPPTPPPFQWGKFHAKFICIDFGTFLRVVVMSANLKFNDWNLASQIIWFQDFPNLVNNQGERKKEKYEIEVQEFYSTLTDFIKCCLPEGFPIHSIIDFQNFDYSEAKVKLISSVPGNHKWPHHQKYGISLLNMYIRKGLTKMGQVNIRCKQECNIEINQPIKKEWKRNGQKSEEIKEIEPYQFYQSSNNLETTRIEGENRGISAPNPSLPILTYSTSSFGHKTTGTFINTIYQGFSGEIFNSIRAPIPLNEKNVEIIFPTEQYVLQNAAGPESGYSLYLNTTWNNSRYFPERRFYKYIPPEEEKPPDPLEEIYNRGLIFHGKVCINTHSHRINDSSSIYLGSHNLSSAAWGHINIGEANNRRGEVISIGNYELGVLLPPLEGSRCCKEEILTGLPLRYPPEKYRRGDIPWDYKKYRRLLVDVDGGLDGRVGLSEGDALMREANTIQRPAIWKPNGGRVYQKHRVYTPFAKYKFKKYL